MKDLLQKYPQVDKKRDVKADKKQQEKLERESQRSGESKVSRSTAGRFEAKYKVGDKTGSGALVK